MCWMEVEVPFAVCCSWQLLHPGTVSHIDLAQAYTSHTKPHLHATPTFFCHNSISMLLFTVILVIAGLSWWPELRYFPSADILNHSLLSSPYYWSSWHLLYYPMTYTYCIYEQKAYRLCILFWGWVPVHYHSEESGHTHSQTISTSPLPPLPFSLPSPPSALPPFPLPPPPPQAWDAGLRRPQDHRSRPVSAHSLCWGGDLHCYRYSQLYRGR